MTTYYVDNVTGNNGDDGLSLANAWSTITYAVTQVAAGDTILVVTTGTDYTGGFTLTSSDSGTSGSRIVIGAYTPDDPPTIAQTSKWVFRGCDYWTIQDLHFEGWTASPGIDVGDEVGTPTLTTGIRFLRCDFWHSAREAVRVYRGADFYMADCYFRDLRTRVAGEDRAAVTVFGCIGGEWNRCSFEDIGSDGLHFRNQVYEISGVLIAYCHFWINRPYGSRTWQDFSTNCGENGIDIKDCTGPFTIRHCLLHGFQASVAGQDVSESDGPAIIIHNANAYVGVSINRCRIYDCDQGIATNENIGTTADVSIKHTIIHDCADYTLFILDAADGLTVEHCTIDNTGAVLRIGQTDILSFQNNYIVGGSITRGSGNTGEANFDWNGWQSITVPAEWQGANDVTVTTADLDAIHSPGSSSQLLNAGTNLGETIDFILQSRDSTPTIGAWESRPALASGRLFDISHDAIYAGQYNGTASDADEEILIDPMAALTTGDYFGMAVFVFDTTDHYRALNFTATSRLRFRFYLDPNRITIPTGSEMIIALALNTSTGAVRVYLRNIGGNYTIRASIRLDSGSFSWAGSSTGYTISDAIHYIEVDAQFATSAGANNGFIRLYIDGSQQGEATSLDNDTITVNRLRIGATSIDTGISGFFFLDNLILNNDGTAIGADGSTPPAEGVVIPVFIYAMRQQRIL